MGRGHFLHHALCGAAVESRLLAGGGAVQVLYTCKLSCVHTYIHAYMCGVYMCRYVDVHNIMPCTSMCDRYSDFRVCILAGGARLQPHICYGGRLLEIKWSTEVRAKQQYGAVCSGFRQLYSFAYYIRASLLVSRCRIALYCSCHSSVCFLDK